MKNIFTFLLIVFSTACFAQDQLTNLQKYWCYRERLREEFMVVSEDVENFGVNIPASMISNASNTIDWSDGNSNMSHYLSVLATELWLLKNNQVDYTQTLMELYYAMLAMERLDLYSESSWRAHIGKSRLLTPDNDINGFHIRDDVSEGFWEQYSSHFKVNNFISVYNGTDKGVMEEISQDNIYHNLEGLALVAKLVGTESVAYIPVTFNNPFIPDYLTQQGIKNGTTIDFSLWAKDFVKRYLKYMQSNHYVKNLITVGSVTLLSTTIDWILLNPVTGNLVTEGSGVEFDLGVFYNTGVVKAAQAITGEDLRTKPPYKVSLDQSLSIFNGFFISGGDFNLQGPVPIHLTSDRYKVSTLATMGSIDGDATFNALRNNQAATPSQPYEQFPMMYEVLNDPTRHLMLPLSDAYEADKANIESLLNAAPVTGPTGDTYPFSSVSRCVWPEKLNDNTGSDVEFSGLDYMLLHNLYYIAFRVEDFNKLIIPSLWPNSTEYQSGTYYASDIETYNTVASTSNLELVALHTVTMGNGFSAQAGSTFSAKIGARPDNYNATLYGPLGGSCVATLTGGGTEYQRSATVNEVNLVSYLDAADAEAPKNELIVNEVVDSASYYDNGGTNSSARKSSEDGNDKGTGADSLKVKSNAVSAPEESNRKQDYYVFPNPTRDKFQIIPFRPVEGAIEVELLNSNGIVVRPIQPLDEVGNVDLSGMPVGVYFIKIYSDHQLTIKKIVIIH